MATVIFKPTEICNARCTYCDVVHKNGGPVKIMPPDILELFFIRVNEFLKERPDESVEVIWHGGEPLLLGPKFFARALEFQRKHCDARADRIRHEIQTNLTLFSREFSPIFRELGIRSVGTSYDLIHGVRGLGKKRNSEAYNRRFMEGVALLEDEGFDWGVIYVVTKLSLEKPLDVFHFLTNLRPGGGISFNPVVLYERQAAGVQVTAREFTEFLGAIFPDWWRHRARYPNVEPFQSLVRNLVDNEKSLCCCDSGDCAYTHINLAPDGRVSQCGRSFDWGLLDYGSIVDRSFSEILADPQRTQLVDRNQVLTAGDCMGCRFWSICHGGCPLDAWYDTRSFMHKSTWCNVKRDFIEEYFEPVVRGDTETAAIQAQHAEDSASGTNAPMQSRERRTRGTAVNAGHDLPWINPIGGLGDTLMISGVLKQVIDEDSARRFNLVERTKYEPILKNHPAIARIGHPPKGARFISTNYWDQEEYALPGKRAYQILAGMFGLQRPVEERLYVPWAFEDNPVLMSSIPWNKHNVVICQSSDSPRKQMPIYRWESLVEHLHRQDIAVVQTGRLGDRYVRGAYSLLGLTTPRQLISIIRHFDAVITSDNFLMHAAHLCGVPAVVLWGPTDHRVYGYSEQMHMQARMECDYPEGCIGPRHGNVYHLVCPSGMAHCMNALDPDDICRSVMRLLERSDAGRRKRHEPVPALE